MGVILTRYLRVQSSEEENGVSIADINDECVYIVHMLIHAVCITI